LTGVTEVAADLDAEQRALDDVVAGLSDTQWAQATPSPNWTVADQIAHLAFFDASAALAIDDPSAFAAHVNELLSNDDPEAVTLDRGRHPAAVLATWRLNRRRLAEAAKRLGDDVRVPWYGPSMGAKSFLTARLMECWAHGQDVCDTFGTERSATDRLRHIAHLGMITRDWTYANRGLDAPVTPVRVVLAAPSGGLWSYGPEDAQEVVSGPALDFCLVVTQRRHLDDTTLRVDGDAARDWLEKAQVFAGGPTDGPAPRGGR
jgi:uncharacterized protein (TIGR03084 family)